MSAPRTGRSYGLRVAERFERGRRRPPRTRRDGQERGEATLTVIESWADRLQQISSELPEYRY